MVLQMALILNGVGGISGEWWAWCWIFFRVGSNAGSVFCVVRLVVELDV